MLKKQIIFSGLQPTGKITLGNYLGAINNWRVLQYQYDCFFCIVDLHALTNYKSNNYLLNNIFYNIAFYIASGLDCKKNIIFQQSSINEHCELAWILSCFCPIGWLNKMIQFKNKIQNNKKNINLGLYSYPILMAADILLYNTNIVPVGKDQKQHIELARDIAININKILNHKFFHIPKEYTNNVCNRIMSLQDVRNKMSKSDASDFSRINVSDSKDLIKKKIRKAKTDNYLKITYDPVNRKEIANLIHIYCGLKNCSINSVLDNIQTLNTTKFKDILSDLIITKICPIHKKATEYLKNQFFIKKIINKGNEKAKLIAKLKINQLKNLLGL